MKPFVFHTPTKDGPPNSVRCGAVEFKGKHIETPAHMPITSRGVVPHLTPDTLSRRFGDRPLYVALEDCE